MSATRHDRVGVRELRQNLSVYLRRVEKGEALEVTDRGKPVAMLVPLPDDDDPLAPLIASGRIIPAKSRIEDILPVRDKPDPKLSRAIRRALEEQREDKI